MKCRGCKKNKTIEILNLNLAPPSNNYLLEDELSKYEIFYPLKVLYCSKCFLVQAEMFSEASKLFDENYAYFSSYSSDFINHAKNYAKMISNKLKLGTKSRVIEVASNDGYLLQFFKQKNIPCLGIEPTLSTAKAAEKKGIKVIKEFMTLNLSRKLKKNNKLADLIIANNVLAHVPDINDFVSGIKNTLKKSGTITFEFPTLTNLIDKNLWDTIYHEHYSYLCLTSVELVLSRNLLKVYDVEAINTHGGSLRVYATHKNNPIKVSDNVGILLNIESKAGVKKVKYYQDIQNNALEKKNQILKFLIDKKKKNKKVVGYGAAAKAATLFNYCGINSDLVQYVVDNNPHKQNKFFPGSRIPIVNGSILKKLKPDYIIIFPWNLKNEILKQLQYAKKWNAKFIVVFPKFEII